MAVHNLGSALWHRFSTFPHFQIHGCLMKNLPHILRHLRCKHSLLGVCANHTQPNLITVDSVANCSWCREAVISLRHLLEKKMKNSLSFSLLSARTISMDSFVPSGSILLRRTFNTIPGNMIKPHA